MTYIFLAACQFFAVPLLAALMVGVDPAAAVVGGAGIFVFQVVLSLLGVDDEEKTIT